MGRAEAFLPYSGTTLIEHCLGIVSRVFSDIILVCQDPDEFRHLSVNVARDLVPGKGPLVGILSGLLLAENEQALVCPCDMPLIDEELILELAARRHDCDIVLYGNEGRAEPLLGVYSKKCIPLLEEMIFSANYSIDSFIAAQKKIIWQAALKDGGLPANFRIDRPGNYGRLLANPF
jgi:molybdopterin-guanine dinucleotide biosynthesis protein A